jgi:hypothetical protein
MRYGYCGFILSLARICAEVEKGNYSQDFLNEFPYLLDVVEDIAFEETLDYNVKRPLKFSLARHMVC